MKISRFNVIKKEEDYMFIYNTLSSSILRLNEEYSAQFNDALASNDFNNIRADLRENLIKGHMILENDISELDYITMLHNINRFSSNSINYTIAPTMKCNFKCPYCYEKGRNYGTMDKDVISDIKSLITSNANNHSYLNITWYGGEPLVAFNIIEELSNTAKKEFGDKYVAAMVTNGYLLTEEITIKLSHLNIKTLQVTIDGPPDIHNERRCLPDKSDTFFVILNNIKRALQVSPELNITIRVNTDKNNIGRVDEILNYLKEFDIDKKVGFYLAPVDNINNTCTDNTCFTSKEYAMEEINFIKEHFQLGYDFAKLPRASIGICGAISSSSYIIDPYGDLYKCWDDIGDKNERLGNIKEMEFKNKNMIKWINYNFLQDEECKKCCFLPVCMGGCPNKQIKNNKKWCIPIKNNYDELISVLAGV